MGFNWRLWRKYTCIFLHTISHFFVTKSYLETFGVVCSLRLLSCEVWLANISPANSCSPKVSADSSSCAVAEAVSASWGAKGADLCTPRDEQASHPSGGYLARLWAFLTSHAYLLCYSGFISTECWNYLPKVSYKPWNTTSHSSFLTNDQPEPGTERQQDYFYCNRYC